MIVGQVIRLQVLASTLTSMFHKDMYSFRRVLDTTTHVPNEHTCVSQTSKCANRKFDKLLLFGKFVIYKMCAE